ncbi:MAG: pilus assembly protein PilM [Gammaproteobacteria bacterium]|nr:MAG: pilus assembly protein PilM [Gammaproteobacteria bacterium]
MAGLFGKKSVPLLGIDITSTSVKLIELSKAGKSYKVESYTVEILPVNSVVDRKIEDSEAVSQALEKALKKAGTKTKAAAVAVAGSSVITKVISMPANLSDSELEDQILIEADQYIPYDMEEVSYDFSVIGPTEGNPDQEDVLLAASQQDNVSDRVAICEAAGLTTKIVDIEAYAIEHAFELLRHQVPDEGIDRVVAIVDIGATTTTVTVLHDGKIIYTRDQTFGGKQLTEEIMRRYGLSYEEAGLQKRQGGLPDNYHTEVLDPFKENIVHEVGRSLQFFFANSAFNTVDTIILAGGTSMIPGVDAMVENKIGAPTVIAEPSYGLKTSKRFRPERLHADAPSLLISFGLALRSFD